MTGTGWVLAAAAASGLLLLRRPRPPGMAAAPRPAGARPSRRIDPQRWARPAALLVGAALGMASHPMVGLLAGGALWWLLPALVSRLDTSERVARRAALAQQLPMAAGLLSACLSAGSTTAHALAITAEAMADPAGDVLQRAARTAALGGGSLELAAVLAETEEPGWRSLGAALLRSSATGAPLADLLQEQADAALGSWAAAAVVRARSAAVRTVLPLALCYLPAFLVLGVAPLVAGLLGGVALT